MEREPLSGQLRARVFSLMRFLLLLIALAAITRGEEFPVFPYTDPAQLDCVWPKSSHYLQPWRGYMETRSGWDFLKGVGVNLHIPDDTEDLAFRLLSETGFRSCRIEVGFGESDWEKEELKMEKKFGRRFELCAKYRLRPTILINAHDGAPCPAKFFKRRLLADAPKGARTVILGDVSNLLVDRSGLSGLSSYWAAEALITEINHETGEVGLSKPLPKELKAGEIAMATLKYAPLHPVGSPEFDETATAWVEHVLRVCRLARAKGVEEFDLEIWNELTFGTHFLDVNNYYDKTTPKIPEAQPDSLHPGGRCWELARRTVEAVKVDFPTVRCIWGFSNTTFYHCPIEKLPPGIEAQSYHPYGTGTRKFDGEPKRKDQPPLEGYVPSYEIRMPEGLMHTFVQTESIIRLINPLGRLRKPPGVAKFHHFMTEHGVLAEECGINDDALAWRLKALCATRSFCLWLNKGIGTVHYFNAHEKSPRSFGVLPPQLRELPPDAQFETIATPPMHAVRNLTRAFVGSIFLERTQPLQIEVTALDAEQKKIFEGDITHPPLWHREVFAALPFQVDTRKHTIAFYVMTRDATRPISPERYRLRISGAFGRKVSCYDPHEDRQIPVEVRATALDKSVEVIVVAAAHPRLLTVEQ